MLSGGEQGLLSVAFDPDYAKTHRFYVDYTDKSGDTHVVQYRSNGTRAIPASAKQLLFVKDFASNHNGGQLQFGPDGRLYWGNGDGGGGGDPEHNGQNLDRPFAKIMRLDVNAAKPRWRLVAYGLRNPWRFSFDRDERRPLHRRRRPGRVGGDRLPAARRRATSPTSAGTATRDARLRAFDGRCYARHVSRAGRRVLALTGGCSVTGGYVYRGKKVPAAAGRYFYGDYCSGVIWSLKIASGRATSRAPRAVHAEGAVVVRRGLDGRAVPDVGHLG